jgi:hypothetical protein
MRSGAYHLGNLHNEVLGSGMRPGMRYGLLRLLLPFQHHDKDGSRAASRPTAGDAAHSLP